MTHDAPRVGFRRWRVNGDGTLRPDSWYSLDAWRYSGEMVAECRHNAYGQINTRGFVLAPHEVPAWSCTCGLHAYHDAGSIPHAQERGLVAGAVRGWGRIIVHTRAFRAERMAIIGLVDTPVARPVAERYNVPVLPLPELRQYAAWFGALYDQEAQAA